MPAPLFCWCCRMPLDDLGATCTCNQMICEANRESCQVCCLSSTNFACPIRPEVRKQKPPPPPLERADRAPDASNRAHERPNGARWRAKPASRVGQVRGFAWCPGALARQSPDANDAAPEVQTGRPWPGAGRAGRALAPATVPPVLVSGGGGGSPRRLELRPRPIVSVRLFAQSACIIHRAPQCNGPLFWRAPAQVVACRSPLVTICPIGPQTRAKYLDKAPISRTCWPARPQKFDLAPQCINSFCLFARPDTITPEANQVAPIGAPVHACPPVAWALPCARPRNFAPPF